MSDDDLFAVPERRARARSTDPDTSHKAADAIDPHVATVRQAVEHYAKQAGVGGFTDEELSAHFNADAQSTYRTRRSELTDENWVVDSGRRVRNSGQREVIVWMHRDYVAQPPAVREPRPSGSVRAKLCADGLTMANTLERFAQSVRNEGRAMFSDELKVAANLLRQLSR